MYVKQQPGYPIKMNLREFFTISTWWGKLLGAFFGYLSGGPLGALFGILIGNFFDRGLVGYYTNPHLLYYSEKRKAVQKMFFETTFLLMGHIAKADGRVSEQEIQIAKIVMNEMRLSNEQKIQAKKLYNDGKHKDLKIDSILYELKKSCHDNRELLKLFIDIQYRAAQVDGLSTEKIKVLNTIFSCLDFAPLHNQNRFYDDFNYSYAHQQEQQKTTDYSSSSQKHHYYKPQASMNNLEHAYALLELLPSANKPEVKRAYRRLISRNHPDKLMAKGLPEAMIKIANDKTQKIMRAYQLICESKGW